MSSLNTERTSTPVKKNNGDKEKNAGSNAKVPAGSGNYPEFASQVEYLDLAGAESPVQERDKKEGKKDDGDDREEKTGRR
ncbi:hypothetical protein Forpe1208_v013596 [Fusarium oxysporum f. sp. rapae]|uniref:Uncharacterized protein n=1 Tax=Fusarium oxysporum f. sp. rapae TaxID=485398 RepID=A0A8J5TNW7_FUSOX|nr:hypothetical protein Forpe1208_v013596 [Fusarium oxysporum f. sp. rapae]